MRREERKPPRLGLAVGIFGIIAIAIMLGYTLLMPAKPPMVAVGDMSPDFEFPIVDTQGISQEKIRLSSLRGKVVFLEFMVSWCRVCQEMAPAIESLRLDYASKGVVFISVAGSGEGATPETTAEFIRSYDTNWTYLFDSDNKAFSAYGVDATPTFFILGGDGRVVSRLAGMVPTESFTTVLDVALSGG